MRSMTNMDLDKVEENMADEFEEAEEIEEWDEFEAMEDFEEVEELKECMLDEFEEDIFAGAEDYIYMELSTLKQLEQDSNSLKYSNKENQELKRKAERLKAQNSLLIKAMQNKTERQAENDLLTTVTELKEEITDLENQLSAANQTIQEKEKTENDLLRAIKELGKEITDSESKLSDMKQEIQEKEQEEDNLYMLVQSLREKNAHLNRELSKADKEIEGRMESEKNLRAESDALCERIDDLENQLFILAEWGEWMQEMSRIVLRSYRESTEALCIAGQSGHMWKIIEKINRRVMD